MRAAITALALTAAIGVSTAASAQTNRSLLAHEAKVKQATVTLPERSCAGVVAGDRDHVATAAHCVTLGAARVKVRFGRMHTVESSVEKIDRDADLALLRLDAPAPVEPLVVAGALPSAGDRLLFVGRTDRRSKTQVVGIDKLGRCPSLPGQPQALFTSVNARPGDSGAPLVDEKLRVVALIHGGSSCHIAAPTPELARWLAAAPAHAPAPPVVADATDDPDERSWFFERTPDGFRFRWKFRWGFSL